MLCKAHDRVLDSEGQAYHGYHDTTGADTPFPQLQAL